MKKWFVFIVLVLGFMAACQPPKDKNQEALEFRITAFMKAPENMLDVSNYEPLSYSALDTLKGNFNDNERAFKLQLSYQGLNSASRKVRREADVFFNKNFEVLQVITTKYLDAMSKEEYKKLGKDQD